MKVLFLLVLVFPCKHVLGEVKRTSGREAGSLHGKLGAVITRLEKHVKIYHPARSVCAPTCTSVI